MGKQMRRDSSVKSVKIRERKGAVYGGKVCNTKRRKRQAEFTALLCSKA